VTLKSCSHPEKQYSQIDSTDEGMKMDKSDMQSENAERPIHDSLESDSNMTAERDRHPTKDSAQSFSTEEGMIIEESDEHFKKAESPIHES
jgi:hypothetical protein